MDPEQSDNGLTERARRDARVRKILEEWENGGREQAMEELERRDQQVERERRDAILAREATPAGDDRRPAPRPTSDHRTAAWQDYIAREITRAVRRERKAMLGAVGEVLAGVRDELRAEHARDLAEIRHELEQLRNDLGVARRTRSWAEVSSIPPMQSIVEAWREVQRAGSRP